MDANVGGSEPNGLTRQGGDAVLAKCAKDGGKGRKGGTALRALEGEVAHTKARSRKGGKCSACGAQTGKWLTRRRGGGSAALRAPGAGF